MLKLSLVPIVLVLGHPYLIDFFDFFFWRSRPFLVLSTTALVVISQSISWVQISLGSRLEEAVQSMGVVSYSPLLDRRFQPSCSPCD